MIRIYEDRKLSLLMRFGESAITMQSCLELDIKLDKLYAWSMRASGENDGSQFGTGIDDTIGGDFTSPGFRSY